MIKTGLLLALAGRRERFKTSASAARQVVCLRRRDSPKSGNPAPLLERGVTTTDMSVAIYLVVHPRGTLLWGCRRHSGRSNPTRRHDRLPSYGQEDAERAAGRDRLQAFRHHVSRAVAQPLRPFSQRQRLRRVHMAGAKSGARRDVLGCPASHVGQQPELSRRSTLASRH